MQDVTTFVPLGAIAKAGYTSARAAHNLYKLKSEFQIAKDAGAAANKIYNKLAGLRHEAVTNAGGATSRRASVSLIEMAKRAGFTVVKDGKHMKVITADGKGVTGIPHSTKNPNTARGIADAILRAYLEK